MVRRIPIVVLAIRKVNVLEVVSRNRVRRFPIGGEIQKLSFIVASEFVVVQTRITIVVLHFLIEAQQTRDRVFMAA